MATYYLDFESCHQFTKIRSTQAAHDNMEHNNNLSNLSFPQGNVSNEELDPRILATFYTTFKIGKISLLIVSKIYYPPTAKNYFSFPPVSLILSAILIYFTKVFLGGMILNFNMVQTSVLQ